MHIGLIDDMTTLIYRTRLVFMLNIVKTKLYVRQLYIWKRYLELVRCQWKQSQCIQWNKTLIANVHTRLLYKSSWMAVYGLRVLEVACRWWTYGWTNGCTRGQNPWQKQYTHFDFCLKVGIMSMKMSFHCTYNLSVRTLKYIWRACRCSNLQDRCRFRICICWKLSYKTDSRGRTWIYDVKLLWFAVKGETINCQIWC